MTLHTVSYGGGVQSTALLALAAQGVIPHRTFLFANVGDDSEAPETLAYVRDVAVPFGDAHGLAVLEIQRTMRDGTPETVLGRIERTAKSEVIPVRSSYDGPPLTRSCTADFKMRTLGKWLTARGATPDDPAHVALGISLDEAHRSNRKPQPYERISYPLIGKADDPCCATDLRIRRSDCPAIIRAVGLPVPPKSSCWFCPFHSLNAWIQLRNDDPARFEHAAQIEDKISTKAGSPRYLTRYGLPLRDVIPADAPTLPLVGGDEDDWSCTSGECGV